MFRKFLKEEKAQAGVEYIILAGGIIVAAVVIFAIYSSMAKSTATALNATTGAKVTEMSEAIANESLT